MTRLLNRKKNGWLFYIALCIIMSVSACDNGTDSSEVSTEAETGTIVFKVVYDEDGQLTDNKSELLRIADKILSPASVMAGFRDDCDDNHTLEAFVYDENDEKISSGGPWNCLAHAGSIKDVLAGINRKIALLVKDGGGNTIYRSEKGGITVRSGEKTEVTLEEPETFSPVLTDNDGNLIASGNSTQIPMRWNEVRGAQKYRVVIKDMNGKETEFKKLETYFEPVGLDPNSSYTCRVFAVDAYGNEGGTGEWTFSLGNDTDEDLDSDGYTEKEGDCNDNDDSVYPGARDIPDDGTDQNCDGKDMQTWYKDFDSDGYSDGRTEQSPNQPDGYRKASELNSKSGDCNDNNAAVHPYAEDILDDGIDQDCDGKDMRTWYKDSDNDGYSDGTPEQSPDRPDAYKNASELRSNSRDCNDNDASVHPEAGDIPDDGTDQDCDGKDMQTWYKDSDEDRYSDGKTEQSPDRPDGYRNASELKDISGDCNDNNADVNPGAYDIPDDRVDQDCDSRDTRTWYKDSDGDGYYSGKIEQSPNRPDSSYRERLELRDILVDCNDNNASVYPGAYDIPGDGIDQDCSSTDLYTEPEISGYPAPSVRQGDTYTFTPTASDKKDPVSILEFSISNQPAWATFDKATGTLTGTPKNEDVGVYRNIKITVTDTDGLSSTMSFDVNVLNVNDAPKIIGEAVTLVCLGNDYAFDPTGFDPDLQSGYNLPVINLVENLSYSIENMPKWAHFDAETGRLYGVPTDKRSIAEGGDVGVWENVTITVTDIGIAGYSGTRQAGETPNPLSASLAFDITVILCDYVNIPPTVANQYFEIEEKTPGGSPIGPVEAQDEDGYVAEYEKTGGSDLFDVNPETGIITVAKDVTVKPGTYIIDVTLRDNDSAPAQGVMTIVVKPTRPSIDIDLDDNNDGGDGEGGKPGESPNFAAIFIEGDNSVRMADIDAIVKDPDSGRIALLTATIDNSCIEPQDVLAAITDGTNIRAEYKDGVLTLSGADTQENYSKVLQSVTFYNSSQSPTECPRIITFVAYDEQGNDSNIATSTVKVIPLNDPPVNNVPGEQVTPVDTPVVFRPDSGNGISVDDPDARPYAITATLSVDTGTIAVPGQDDSSSIVLNGTIEEVNAALNGLTYTPPPGWTGTANLTVVTNDEGHTGYDEAAYRNTGQLVAVPLTDTDTVPILIGTNRKVYFPDVNLRSAISSKLNVPTEDGYFLESDLLKLTSLEAEGKGIENISGLEYCKNLKYLYLSLDYGDSGIPYKNSISDLTPIENLSNLKSLHLYGNRLDDSDLIHLAKLTQLRWLVLSENQISDISPLTNLTQLTELRLAINQISDISPLSNLTQLTSLDLASNQISDISPLSNLTQLTELRLGSNDISNISYLSNLTQLTELVLPWNRISDINPLAKLTQLTALYLGSNQISDISPLTNLTQLTVIGLANNQISNISPLANLTQLTWLDLNINQISDIGALAKLTQLTSLAIGDDRISDISPLTNLTQLTWLELTSNQIIDIGALAKLTQLTWLGLRSNQISDISPLAKLTQLTELYLNGNQISDIKPLVDNEGIGSGDIVHLYYSDYGGNPLSSTSCTVYIPQLQNRGVTVEHNCSTTF